MRKFAVAFVSICLVPTVYAQEGRRGAAPLVRLNVESEAVKGAPYSAEVINESTQTLTDGNHIFHRGTSRVYRDSEGRTRREAARPSGSPAVTISDPVAGTTLRLDVDNHTAQQGPGVLRLYNATLGSYNAALGQADELKRLTVLLNGQPGVFAGGSLAVARGNEQSTEERLAPRVIEGLRVEGLRRTATIAAGAIGNERPIVVTSEEWTSPELKTLVLSEHSDPRTGTSTYKLVRVSRTEPAASLFQVPPAYTIVQVAGRGEGRGGARSCAPPR